jgi:hypothetical protein
MWKCWVVIAKISTQKQKDKMPKVLKRKCRTYAVVQFFFYLLVGEAE